MLAVEDVYVAPLAPFLKRMGEADFEAGRRDHQLAAAERVVDCFSGPVLDLLRSSPAEALPTALNGGDPAPADPDRRRPLRPEVSGGVLGASRGCEGLFV